MKYKIKIKSWFNSHIKGIIVIRFEMIQGKLLSNSAACLEEDSNKKVYILDGVFVRDAIVNPYLFSFTAKLINVTTDDIVDKIVICE